MYPLVNISLIFFESVGEIFDGIICCFERSDSLEIVDSQERDLKRDIRIDDGICAGGA